MDSEQRRGLETELNRRAKAQLAFASLQTSHTRLCSVRDMWCEPYVTFRFVWRRGASSGLYIQRDNDNVIPCDEPPGWEALRCEMHAVIYDAFEQKLTALIANVRQQADDALLTACDMPADQPAEARTPRKVRIKEGADEQSTA